MNTAAIATEWWEYFNGLTYQQITDWFTYHKNNPLLFSSGLFLGLFLVFYAVYIVTRKHSHFRTVYVTLFSLFFYYKAGGNYFVLLILSSLMDYYFAGEIHKSENPARRKLFLAISMVTNLGLLGYFKYTNFLIDSFNAILSSNFALQDIFLPVGISFYTFQTMSYTIDVYRREITPAKSFLDFTFFVCFFPQLVAGPIVRAKDFIPQIYKKISLTKEETSLALFLIIGGLLKKAVISDYISLNFVDRVFEAPNNYSAIENLLAVYGYTLQIYCDFSGYSDMAIGLALLMGFTLPTNFRTPYQSQNITEFWHRWHISLSTWLKDYLYIPLGGNRNSTLGTFVFSLIFVVILVVAIGNLTFTLITGSLLIIGSVVAFFYKPFERYLTTNINIMLTMLIGGLWHGAAWKFAIWGGLNGLGVIAYKYWRKVSPYENSASWVARAWKILFTFSFITFTRIFFRSNDMEGVNQWFAQVAHNMDWDSAMSIIRHNNIPLAIIVIGYITHWLPQRWKDYIEYVFAQSHYTVKVAITLVVVLICYQAYSTDIQPFIYFQF